MEPGELLQRCLDAGYEKLRCFFWALGPLLGGSWVVISRVTILITHTRGLTTPLVTTPEGLLSGCWV